MLATVESINESALTVRLDGDKKHRRLTIDLNTYRDIDHGYAVTIHKSQGATVDRAFVLTSPDLQPDLTYVAMTRHRQSLNIYQTPKRHSYHPASRPNYHLSR